MTIMCLQVLYLLLYNIYFLFDCREILATQSVGLVFLFV